MHRYTVELRIVGKELDPDEVTRRLGLEPSQACRNGDRRSESSTRTADTWSFEVLPPARDDWPSLAEGLGTWSRCDGQTSRRKTVGIFQEMYDKRRFDSDWEYRELRRILSEAISGGYVEQIKVLKPNRFFTYGRVVSRQGNWGSLLLGRSRGEDAGRVGEGKPTGSHQSS